MDPLELLVDALATYRLTRLATADIISEPLRQSIIGRLLLAGPEPLEMDGSKTAQEVVEGLESPPKAASLITCRWCAGVWIAGGVVAARSLMPKAWQPVSRGLALSAGAALFSRLEDG